jgi:hypothetical protein
MGKIPRRRVCENAESEWDEKAERSAEAMIVRSPCVECGKGLPLFTVRMINWRSARLASHRRA